MYIIYNHQLGKYSRSLLDQVSNYQTMQVNHYMKIPYLASQAACTRCTASSKGTTDLPATCPHLFGET